MPIVRWRRSACCGASPGSARTRGRTRSSCCGEARRVCPSDSCVHHHRSAVGRVPGATPAVAERRTARDRARCADPPSARHHCRTEEARCGHPCVQCGPPANPVRRFAAREPPRALALDAHAPLPGRCTQRLRAASFASIVTGIGDVLSGPAGRERRRHEPAAQGRVQHTRPERRRRTGRAGCTVSRSAYAGGRDGRHRDQRHDARLPRVRARPSGALRPRVGERPPYLAGTGARVRQAIQGDQLQPPIPLAERADSAQ